MIVLPVRKFESAQITSRSNTAILQVLTNLLRLVGCLVRAEEHVVEETLPVEGLRHTMCAGLAVSPPLAGSDAQLAGPSQIVHRRINRQRRACPTFGPFFSK